MLYWLPAPLIGVIASLLLVLNTLFWVVPVYLLILVKVITPKGRLRDAVSRGVAWNAQRWAVVDVMMTDAVMRVRWDIRMHTTVDPQGQYLVCSNHQTWNDILVLVKAFGGRAPFFKFFLKQELIWVPVLGLAWWGLDYPFMKRHTKEQIAKNPALKGQDIETTRKACEAFRNQPALILNFLEGTRFTPEKRAKQQSPYQYLLKPKSGGFAFTLSALGERLHSLLDVTIVYPDGPKGFWDFLCGRMGRVIVDVRQLEVPHELFHGSYESDPEFRARFHTWIASLWSAKDQRIAELLAEANRAR
jgi:1-acyl-sn-glycerol-3-phosphate acyltransferase